MKRSDSHRGFVLMTVLLTTVLLVSLVLGFNRQTREHLNLSGEVSAGLRAQLAARSAIRLAMQSLLSTQDIQSAEALKERFDPDEPFRQNETTCTLRVTAENGKFNVNALLDGSSKPIDRRVEQLLRLIDLLNRQPDRTRSLRYGIVPALIDWIDTDHEETVLESVAQDNRGAETATYRRRTPAYRSKNAPLQTRDELLLIRGIDPKNWLGDEQVSGLRDVLTIYGTERIDLNTADALVLQCLDEQIDSGMAQLLIQRRTLVPFESLEEFQEAAGIPEAVISRITSRVEVDPPRPIYTITCDISAGDVRLNVEAVVQVEPAQQHMSILEYRESSLLRR